MESKFTQKKSTLLFYRRGPRDFVKDRYRIRAEGATKAGRVALGRIPRAGWRCGVATAHQSRRTVWSTVDLPRN